MRTGTGINRSLSTLTSPSVVGALTVTRTALGTTSTDGAVLQNTTAATAGAQQISPRLHFSGRGWKTDATAASQAVDVITELLPVQGTSAPTGNLLWKASVNGGAYSTILTLGSGGVLQLVDGTAAAPSLTFANDTNTGIYSVTGDVLGLVTGGSERLRIDGNGAIVSATGLYQFGSSGLASPDNSIGRAAATSLYVSKGLHVGGTSDAGDNNLLVDGTVEVAAASSIGFTSRGSFAASADGALVWRNNAATNTFTATVADWGTALSGEAVPVANDAVLFLGATPTGLLMIAGTAEHEHAIYSLRGSGQQTREVFDPEGVYTITKDNATTINIYYDASGASGAGYYMQNKRTASRTFRLALFGA